MFFWNSRFFDDPEDVGNLISGSSVVSNSLWPHGLQRARLPCPSLSPGVCSKGDSSLHWVSYAIQQSHPGSPFPSCCQSSPAPGSFPISQLFASDGQSIGASTESSITSQNLSLLVPTSIPSHPQVLIPKVFSKPLASCLCLTVSLLANLACNSILYTSLLLVS